MNKQTAEQEELTRRLRYLIGGVLFYDKADIEITTSDRLDRIMEKLLPFIESRDAKQKEEWEKEGKLVVAGKDVEFTHTAVNKNMHLFIDGYHDPDVCPECISPGLLVAHLSSKEQGDK